MLDDVGCERISEQQQQFNTYDDDDKLITETTALMKHQHLTQECLDLGFQIKWATLQLRHVGLAACLACV